MGEDRDGLAAAEDSGHRLTSIGFGVVSVAVHHTLVDDEEQPDGRVVQQPRKDSAQADARRLLCAGGDDRPGIWSLRASDGTDPQPITNSRGDTPVGYSPDGSQVAFIRTLFPASGDDQQERSALFVVRSNGKGLGQLTDYGAVMGREIASADWSADGRTLISSTPDGRLITVDIRRHTICQIQLAVGTTDYFAFAPSYSADNRRIAFSLSKGGAPDIYTARPDATGVQQVTDNPEAELFPDRQ